MSNHRRLVQQHAKLFNQGVRTGNFGPMIAGFTDDAELIFHGIPVGPFRGKPAIAAAYRTRPPDDEIAVLATREENGKIIAEYAWRRAPRAQAGGLIITPAGDKIARLVVIYGASKA